MLSEIQRNQGVILNVDDYEAGRYAITRVLERASFAVREASTGAQALELVATEHPDVVLLDVNLPDMSGFEVCRRIKADPSTARIPVLHISASSVEAGDKTRGLEGGADTYLTEPVEPEVLVATVKAVLRTRRAEDAMRAMALQWQITFDAIADGVALVDGQGRIVRWNRSLERLMHRSAETIAGALCYALWDDAEERPAKLAFLRAIESLRREEMDVRRGGKAFHVTVDPVLDSATGEMNGAVYLVSDTTERMNLEEQFRQAQKFESISQLAGGVAHDFNNLLTSILGNASLVLGDLSPDDPVREKIEEVMRAGNRAADLTKQLLAYSGKGRFIMKRLDLSKSVTEMQKLLESSVPKKVRLRLELAPALPAVEADPAQIRQALLNLVLNAAEAIGEGAGEIRIRTGTLARTDETPPRTGVFLEVSDTGCGIDENARAHLFEPFFTTKFMGRGLGLSAVSGIVRGHRGSIEVVSAPGKGATFRIVIPAVEAEPAAVPRAKGAGAPGAATVLVVDDEEMVRRMAKAALEIRGYRVLVAENGQEAVDIVREKGAALDLVLLDLTMPVMAGEEAMEQISRLNPGLKVIASSGYDEEQASRRFGRKIRGFLQKPYTSRQLAEKIRSALEAG